MDDDKYIEAHQEGMSAFKNGKPQDENPYERGTDAYSGWNDGWLDAAYSVE